MTKLKHRAGRRAAPKPPIRTLRVLRAERELTQQGMAAGTGLTQTRYWQIEHGSGAPLRSGERAAIARLLHLPADQIAWPVMRQLTQLQLTRAEAHERRHAGDGGRSPHHASSE